MPSPDALQTLIKELKGKGLLNEANEQKLHLEEADTRGVRVRILGFIDGLIEANQISREQAEPHIHQLGLAKEEVDRMRTSLRAQQERTRRLN